MSVKPKRWIERFRLKRADELHAWLMLNYGFQKYVDGEMWKCSYPDLESGELQNFFMWLDMK